MKCKINDRQALDLYRNNLFFFFFATLFAFQGMKCGVLNFKFYDEIQVAEPPEEILVYLRRAMKCIGSTKQFTSMSHGNATWIELPKSVSTKLFSV